MGKVYFGRREFLSTDPALDKSKMFNDMGANKALGLSYAVGAGAQETGLPIDGKLIIVAAAGDIAGARMQALNAELEDMAQRGEKACVIVAGAGHYALPPEGTAEEEIDLTTQLNPKYVHAALSNFSVGNSHTKAFSKPHSHIKYLLASHCSSETLSGNAPTIQSLMENDIVPNENIVLYDALLTEDELAYEGEVLIGSGTGAPPAVIALISAMRQEAGITQPLDVRVYGMDGTTNFLYGVEEKLPEDYQARLKDGNVLVDLAGEIYDVQEVFLDQAEQISIMLTDYPELIASVEVDNPESLAAAILEMEDGQPVADYDIVGDEMWGFRNSSSHHDM